MRFILANLLALVFVPVVCAQRAPRVTVTEIHPAALSGSMNEYTPAPPDIILAPQGQGARRGRLWIRNTGNGLLIVGDIEGGPPDFPGDKRSLFVKDHVEVWLAADVDAVLQPIGWGNQFGENALAKGADSCEDYLKEAEAPVENSPESV